MYLLAVKFHLHISFVWLCTIFYCEHSDSCVSCCLQFVPLGSTM